MNSKLHGILNTVCRLLPFEWLHAKVLSEDLKVGPYSAKRKYCATAFI